MGLRVREGSEEEGMCRRQEERPSRAEGASSEKGSQPLLGSLTRCPGMPRRLLADLLRDVEK